MLGGLRQVADEVVVAVDVSAGEQDLTPLGAVADRVFEIELDAFPEPAMAWLHDQCAADWILRVDDDEVVAPGLLEQLPELVRARDVVQYWIARRWLHPDAGCWLEQWPWFPDFQGRLVRNDAQLWFPGLCHSPVALALPARYLEAGLYHLAHLLSDRQQRERKVRRYLEVDTTLRATAADAHLADYYLPERRPGARLTAVDARDRHAIDAALTAAVATAAAPGACPRARRVTKAEMHARWAARSLDGGAYRARMRPIDVHRRLVADDHRPFRVEVENAGTEWWPGGEDRQPLIRAAYRWLTPDGEVAVEEGVRTALPHPLAPGRSCLVAMNVTAPSRAGPFLLAPDLVHEHVRWFDCDSPTVEMLVTAPAAAR